MANGLQTRFVEGPGQVRQTKREIEIKPHSTPSHPHAVAFFFFLKTKNNGSFMKGFARKYRQLNDQL